MGKEIISQFKENPKTKITWWAMGLGLATILIGPILGIFAAGIRPIINRTGSENTGISIGFGVVIFSLILSVAALVTGIRAFRKGERSWALWLGVCPSCSGGSILASDDYRRIYIPSLIRKTR